MSGVLHVTEEAVLRRFWYAIARSDAVIDGWRIVHEPESEWSCPAPVLLDNNLDPGFAVIRIECPDGLTHVMLKACTPTTDTSARELQVVLRNDGEADRPAADIIAFGAQVWEEDEAVLEHLVEGFHLDLAANVHLRTDRTSIDYRRWLAELVAGPP